MNTATTVTTERDFLATDTFLSFQCKLDHGENSDNSKNSDNGDNGDNSDNSDNGDNS